jgi:hypothetical protein
MRQRQPETGAAPLDPIPLSLALWLGLMVGVLGLQHMSEQAAAQQAAQEHMAQQNGTGRHTPTQPYAAWSR